jgi:ABC-type antimicrobial peptide transport system permease subunit
VQTAGEDRQVIGIVETGKYRSLGEEPTEFMYLPERELFRPGLTLLVRTPRSPDVVLAAIRDRVRGLDPNMPLFDVRTMADHMGIALLPARLGGTVLGIFGFLGLGLAAVGIYGVMAFSVAQRQRELGIRVALGADQPQVVHLVLREGLTLACIGIVLGLAGAVGASQLVKGMLYNVHALDPIAFSVVPALLLFVAAMAVYFPARRASRVEPMRVLKVD